MTTQLDITYTLVQNDELLSTDIDDETVLMSLETDKYYGLDPVSAEIWQQIAQPKTLSAVCEQLLETFDVSPETCQQDVLEFAQTLIEAKLAHIVTV